MEQILYVAGIQSRDAYLVGIPERGTHAMVEVSLGDKGSGLFDPTYGTVFFDAGRRSAVGIADLITSPARLPKATFRTVDAKRRQNGDPVRPIAGFSRGYRRSSDAVIRNRWSGWTDMD